MTTTGRRSRAGRLVHDVASAPAARLAAFALLLAGPILLRLHSSSDLWLDETLSVNISRLPLPGVLAALRQDGSPPLYYVLLHGWMGLFGTGDDAVRALSTVFSLLALVVAFPVGRRLAGPAGGSTAVVLLAAFPFAIRYATETRMYALVMLLVMLGILAGLRLLDRPSPARMGWVTLASGALALTHYWTLFFLLAAEVVVLVVAATGYQRRASIRLALALPAGGLLFLPWLPSFLFQVQHTGTPWGVPPSWTTVLVAIGQWGGPGWTGLPLTLVLLGLVVVGLRRGVGRCLLAVSLITLLLGVGTSRLQGSGFSLRYSAPAVVPFLMAATVGAVRVPPRVRAAALTVCVALSLVVAGTTSLFAARTQSGLVATALRAGLGPHDLVVYCPDQIGPAIDRLLPRGVDEVVYPTMGPPQRIDWVDYAQRQAAADPAAFATAASGRADGAVWLVSSDGYRTFGTQCADLASDLALWRGAALVVQEPTTSNEELRLLRFPAVAGS